MGGSSMGRARCNKEMKSRNMLEELYADSAAD